MVISIQRCGDINQRKRKRKVDEDERRRTRAQINAFIRDEIQEGINDYIDAKEESEKSGIYFVDNKDEELRSIYLMQRLIDS